MNTRKLIFTFLLATLAACTDPPPPVVEEAVLPDYSHIVCKPSVHPFWTKFREAVLKEDWEAVAELTEFPLVVIRNDDFKGNRISRQDFAKQFPQFLNAPHGEKSPHPDLTMKGLIRSIPTLHKKACGDFEGLLAIGEWRFFLRAEGWRLANVYVLEFPTSMKIPPQQP